MDFAEKLIALRKGRELTQEQLAERLNVSRQSVSKWESGQVVPEVEKIVELSRVFEVSIDYLLKPSELDVLSVKTQMLEQQQNKMLVREQKRTRIFKNIMYSVVVYLILMAVLFVEHELVFGLESMRNRRKFMLLFMVLAVCLCGGCGQASREAETDIAQESGENIIQDEEDGLLDNDTPSSFPASDAIKDSICHYYGREEQEKITEEEAAAVKGKLPAYSLTVRNGEEFALMREWYDWTTVHSVTVYFSKDLKEWREEDLRALSILEDEVYVESDSDTFPAYVLAYLTSARNVYFFSSTDGSDVTGALPEGACFPRQIKSVALYGYREGKYAGLLHLLEDSQVETVTIRPDSAAEGFQRFWLDDAARIGTLKELIMDNITIQVREETSLDGCGLMRIEGFIDQDTDLCFVESLAQLQEVTSRIVDERDLSSLLQRKGLSLYLEFYKKTFGFEEEDYGGGNYTVCPDFNRMVSLPLEAEDNKFLSIYQRREDQGRVAECFVTDSYPGISDREEELNLLDTDPWIRVTDGSNVYELKPEEGLAFVAGIRNRMRFEDINFDGVKDVVLTAGYFGNQGLCYEFGWIWNQKSGRYEASPTYSMIGNPSIDSQHQLVRSSWRNWAASHSWAIYRYVDGEFVMQSRLTEEPLDEDEIPAELEVPEDAEVWRWQEEIMENGEVAEVRNSYAVSVEGEENVYPEVYESYYAEDSYWGDGNE